MAGNHIIQGLWIGEALSTLERLSLASFLACGHEYHLYVYRPVAHLPAGTVLKDAREILPESRIFKYRKYPSYAGFANFFRYKLLLERGGWWFDTDTVCLRPIGFPQEHVFGSERTVEGGETPANAFIKAPAGSEVMAFAWCRCQGKDPADLTWGETGPRLIAEAIRRSSLEYAVQPFLTFAPIPFFQWEQVLDPERFQGDFAGTHTVHLWNEMWRRAGRDKDARYHPDCLYERLKTRYL
jgi:hypothetical protein